MARSKLMEAFHNYEINYREYLDKAKILKGTTGEERVRLQDQLADWIMETYPLKVRIPPEREMTESERNAVDVVFSDSLNGSLRGAGIDYESLENARTIALYRTNLDVGYIEEPEESDYRKLASWKLVYAYPESSDEEILSFCEKYDAWELLCKVMEKGEPIRIWYTENPSELCGFYYLCSFLTDYPGDVYAVKIPDRVRYKNERKFHPVYMSGQIGPDNAARIVETAVKLSSWEIKMYAAEWKRLKQENSPLRTVISGKVVSVGAGFYDGIILTHVPDEPTREKQVFGNVLAAMPYIQQGWITFRLQRLIDREYIVVEKDDKDPSKRLIRRKSELSW